MTVPRSFGRRCARWSGFLFLLAGAAIPPPLAAQVPARQTVIIIHTATIADTFMLTQAPAKIELWLARDTTATRAHVICGYSYVALGAQPWAFAIRWAGDTLRRVAATWRPFCQR